MTTNQKVNLYEKPMTEGHYIFTFDGMFLVAEAAVVLIVGVVIFYFYQGWSIQKKLDDLTVKHSLAEQRLLDTSEKYPSKTVDKKLEQTINKLAEERNDKMQVIKAFTSESVSNSTGFSNFLEVFSRDWVEGMWMTKLSLKESGNRVLLQGGTNSPATVSKLLKNLRGEPLFSKASFDNLKFTQNKEQNTLDFMLQTKVEIKKQ